MQYQRTGPLSFSQEILLFSELLQSRSPTVSRLVRITGNLDMQRFARAANAVVAAHEPLRSLYVPRIEGPVCQVMPPADVGTSYHYSDLRSGEDPTSALRWAYGQASFAAGQVPQIRHSIARIEEDAYLWAFGVHHIATDAISLQIYAQTFRQAYDGDAGAPAVTTSIDYAKTQHEWLSSAAAQAELEWWLRRLEGFLQASDLSTSAPPSSGGRCRLEARIALPAGRTTINRRARDWRVPPAALFLGAFARMLAAVRSTSKVKIFTNLPGRSLAGASMATGAFYNTLPVVIDKLPTDPRSAAERAAETLYEMLDHQEVPIALLNLAASKRGASLTASGVAATFNIIEHPLASWRLPGCRLDDVELKTLELAASNAVSATPVVGHASAADETMDWLVTMLPSALVIAVEFGETRWSAQSMHAMLDAYRSELSHILDLDSCSAAGNLSVVADWTDQSTA